MNDPFALLRESDQEPGQMAVMCRFESAEAALTWLGQYFKNNPAEAEYAGRFQITGPDDYERWF